MAETILTRLQFIKYLDIWMASDLLHPGYRSMLLVNDKAEREEYATKGRALIRILMDQMNDHVDKMDSVDSSNVNTMLVDGERSLHLEYLMCLDKYRDCDELSTYEKETLTAQPEEDLKTENGEIRFWVCAKNKYPCPHRAALCCIAVPVSSM